MRHAPKPYGTRYTAVWLYSPKGVTLTDDGLLDMPSGIGLATPRVCMGDPRQDRWERVSGTICIIYPALDTKTRTLDRLRLCLAQAKAKRILVVWPDERPLEVY